MSAVSCLLFPPPLSPRSKSCMKLIQICVLFIPSIVSIQTMGRKPKLSTHNVASGSSNIDVHVFEPQESNEDACEITGTIVTVHPWATLGGGEHNTIGMAKYITSQSESNHKWRVITFTLQSSGAVWGILSGHNYEVRQIIDVTKWAMDKYGTVVLLGSSAGAPMAGTAMHQLVENESTPHQLLIAYIAVGYTFGRFASLGFGRHFSSVTATGNTNSICGTDSTYSNAIKIPPKLFIMGENDEFTTVSQLEEAVAKMKANCSSGRVDTHVVSDIGHFQLESPSYDAFVSKLAIDWLEKIIP